MTSPPSLVADAIVREAHAAADVADRHAGITTRRAVGAELDAALARFVLTWGEGHGPDRSILQALDHAGNTLLVAVPEVGLAEPEVGLDERVEGGSAQLPSTGSGNEAGSRNEADSGSGPPTPALGAVLGFLGWNSGLHLHSHMNSVDPAARGRGIGLALKLRQRALCLEHGITEIRWTYDPLIRRNARMNLVRLGAEVMAYHPDFYGLLDDAITGADHSDRFEVRWRLDSPRTARALAGRPQPTWASEGGFRLVPDFEARRADDPAEAARLRERSRAAFAVLITRAEAGAADAGADATAVRRPALRPELDAAGDYVFTTDDPDLEA